MAGDFAEVAYSVIRDRALYIGENGRYTVDEVNDALDELSRAQNE
jgi:DNA ligase-4